MVSSDVLKCLHFLYFLFQCLVIWAVLRTVAIQHLYPEATRPPTNSPFRTASASAVTKDTRYQFHHGICVQQKVIEQMPRLKRFVWQTSSISPYHSLLSLCFGTLIQNHVWSRVHNWFLHKSNECGLSSQILQLKLCIFLEESYKQVQVTFHPKIRTRNFIQHKVLM